MYARQRTTQMSKIRRKTKIEKIRYPIYLHCPANTWLKYRGVEQHRFLRRLYCARFPGVGKSVRGADGTFPLLRGGMDDCCGCGFVDSGSGSLSCMDSVPVVEKTAVSEKD